jgi:putative ABC transport system permease protein
VLVRVATPGYFETMDIRVLTGRTFRPNEGRRGFLPVVVNQSFAKQTWPNDADPTGQRIRYRGDTSRSWMTVVGVTRDDRHYGLAQPMRPSVFLPMTVMDTVPQYGSFGFLVHAAGDPAALYSAIRGIARDLDPEIALFDTRTMRAALDNSLAIRRALTAALAIFAGIALTLAIGGIYAVLSYVVGRRRHEIGIRIALGAQRTQVVGHVVRQGLRLVVVGTVIGLPLAYLASTALGSLLVGVSAHDPLTYALVLLALGATGAVAALIPARRAASVQPMEALVD